MKYVAGRLRGERPGKSLRTRRDQIIARRLQETFDRDLELARVSGLNLFVQNSVVTLYGTIRNELDREIIVSIARHVAGVRDVVDHLQVAPAADEPASEKPGVTRS